MWVTERLVRLLLQVIHVFAKPRVTPPAPNQQTAGWHLRQCRNMSTEPPKHGRYGGGRRLGAEGWVETGTGFKKLLKIINR